ncbi:hypothetical protein M4I32_04860 [Microbacterium sp. LRZ72]|uniref:hypothetical protein n=1 Tax=Microbacterium sp. LRZ72 TaxID=2942481 RepID=UPI0029A9F84F|nr:hypothetical protein [Microbacterium sp. LRZ72]MDX2376127.1 hypothetical protein [Microbacterium sp. LRZ72]
MDQGVTRSTDAPAPGEARAVRDPVARRMRRRDRRRADLAVLLVVGVLLMAAFAAGGITLYHAFYGPSAFVERYVGLLAEGRAADALEVPGVRVDSTELAAAGLPETASDALLRRDALSAMGDIEVVDEQVTDDGVAVTLSYRSGSYTGTSTYLVDRNGWAGVVPAWRFVESPLAVLDVTVNGSMSFEVNGFTLDKRQISPLGADADPLESMSMLVFSPGRYRVAVDTVISSTRGVDVLADVPLAGVGVEVNAEPTEQFVSVVQDEVDDFLDACAEQQVLQPTACPFGYVLRNRIASLPSWSIRDYPVVELVPDGADWAVPSTAGVAHLEVDELSLFDGTVRPLSEDVPFALSADVALQPDGTVSIRVSSG